MIKSRGFILVENMILFKILKIPIKRVSKSSKPENSKNPCVIITLSSKKGGNKWEIY